MGPTFTFASELFPWEAGEGSWVFASLPVDVSDVIKDIVPVRRGFGSVRVQVRIGDVEWRTSIFPSTEMKTYVLPIKKDVRRRRGIDIGDTVELELDVLIED